MKLWIRRHPNVVAYMIITVIMVVALWAFSTHNSKELKHQLNVTATHSCIESRPLYGKFNDLVTSIVTSRQANLLIDTAAGDKLKIAADNLALKHYQHDFLIAPTVADCRIPILK